MSKGRLQCASPDHCCKSASTATNSAAVTTPGTTMFTASSTFSLTSAPRDTRSHGTCINRAINGTLMSGETIAMKSTSVAAARGCPLSRYDASATYKTHMNATGSRGRW